MAAVVPIDARLEVGAVSDTVEVTAATPLLETETSATRHADGRRLLLPDAELPAQRQGHHAHDARHPTIGRRMAGILGQLRHQRRRVENIGYFEDGMYGVSPNNNGMSTDTIENTIDEVKVLTSALPAEYGHSASGAITVAKKFGTNQFHGLASEYGRVGAMQHRYFFQEYTNDAPPPYGQSELFQMPDWNVNGPVYLPKIYDGRNKTFFMVAGERLIEKQGFGSIYDVPTPLERAGNFSYPEDAARHGDLPDLRSADHPAEQRRLDAPTYRQQHHSAEYVDPSPPSSWLSIPGPCPTRPLPGPPAPGPPTTSCWNPTGRPSMNTFPCAWTSRSTRNGGLSPTGVTARGFRSRRPSTLRTPSWTPRGTRTRPTRTRPALAARTSSARR